MRMELFFRAGNVIAVHFQVPRAFGRRRAFFLGLGSR